jgi:solute carrier family 25 iron transporter 28/37
MGSAEVDLDLDLEWEEWDGSSPFLHHCLAGGVAGLAEHCLLYPVDTVKTHMQSYCAICPHKSPSPVSGTSATAARVGAGPMQQLSRGPQQEGMWRTLRKLVSHPSHAVSQGRAAGSLAAADAFNATATYSNYSRLWRGVQAMAVGCVPAHALYFSSYEAVKHLCSTEVTVRDAEGHLVTQHHLSAAGSSAAGAAATLAHDVIMTPLDTAKQRLQLGHYRGLWDALHSSFQNDRGLSGLYRSFPITLATNVPYGMIMVTTNEFLKDMINPHRAYDLQSTLLAGCGAGFVAAAITAPLDRVKTRLQTQQLSLKATCPGLKGPHCSPKYAGWRDATTSILKEEGAAGFFRGLSPRLLTHTPAVAISWTSYEVCKQWLLTALPPS